MIPKQIKGAEAPILHSSGIRGVGTDVPDV